ncbi:hypothetical protein DTO006G1_6133 [Penicillium roqueforti]|uniref:Src homology-3 domain n=1 Tax=Penicillium roqueforti (strain FM164) TaxID=1365484 RepID=W6QQX8_PENRF|nr:hypothetical protein CBS147337_3777 [Penicillium roqueforti]CDM31952.1 Src homology-3 domain [Penicillium roqueforti FM164]KAI2698354.1 hypothetical protein CBS147372_6884 [Penicillium roqueforti]KAI2712212.1 hypothetical protein CBS147354_8084 [Penicillium roqueforti]KAI2720642.1 hypothetical protein CBS147332_3882 [Penicillium roqueforti]
MAPTVKFASAMTTRSLRMVRTELEFLADASVITPNQLSTILSQLPADSEVSRALQASPSEQAQPAPVQQVPVQAQPPPAPYSNTPSYSAPVSQMSNMSVNEKAALNNQYASPPPQAPPSYLQAPPLRLAVAMYEFKSTDPGDLDLKPHDRVQITEEINAHWWRGRNERTGQEGIFPGSYVDEKAALASPPPQSTDYGNMPLAVSQSGQPENPEDPKKNKFEEGGKKFGKKLGNAAIFGAGATVGSNIVNSIF